MLKRVKAGNPALGSSVLQPNDQSHWGIMRVTADGMYVIMQTRL